MAVALRTRLLGRGRSKTVRRVGRPPLVPTTIIILSVVLAFAGQALAPYDPNANNLLHRFTPPVWQEGGNWSHPLGTDQLGRDILSRIMVGSRVSLAVASVALFLGVAVGASLGLIAAYFGGWVDSLLMRLTDSVIPIPIILVGLLLAISFGPSFPVVVIAIAAITWARFARIVRGEALSLVHRDFVNLAKVAGSSPLRIMIRHLFPNVANTLLVLLTLQIGSAILVEASLSFLGAGIPPPEPSWGRMVSDGRQYIVEAWWLAALPGVAIMLVVMSFNLFGDWLRDRLDPGLRQV
ncbi:MAG TPA: ABC transporter permease [Dehalococcoidia bacterium]|nr:ABC transporter permease [Dehalococcoidia bacterium]